MTSNGGGWTLCLSNIARGKGLMLNDTNSWWTTVWDKGVRTLTRGNKNQGSSWGNFCQLLMPTATQIYSTIYSESNGLTVGDMCTLDPSFFIPGSFKTLTCAGGTNMAVIPKNGFDNNGCVNCIFWDNTPTPNTQATGFNHNYYGSHVMVRPQGQNAYGCCGVHWGNVNGGMSEGNAGDVNCGK